MAYIFKTKDEVLEYLGQMEFTFSGEYSHYIVPHKVFTTRFNILYKGEEVGFVENENFKDTSSNLWVIHIPTEKRSYLEANQPGLYEAIFDEPTNSDGDIDKKYYIDPKAFNKIVVKDSNNISHQIRANGPGAYLGLNFPNSFVKVTDGNIDMDTTQVTIDIDSKILANQIKYDLAEVVGNYSVTEPESITVKNVTEYPSVVVAGSRTERPHWVPLNTLEVERAAIATKAESLDGVSLEKFITVDNFNDVFTDIITNSTQYGLNFGFNLENDTPYVYIKRFDVNLIGDISGSGTVENFEDLDIECTLAPAAIEKIANRTGKSITFNTEKFEVNGMSISKDDEGNTVFNVDADKTYKFNINDTTAFTINTGGGNDIAEEFSSDPGLNYIDGDLVGICDDGIVRPLAYGTSVNYIGVVTKKPAVVCGSIEDKNKVLVALIGKKDCYVKTNTTNILGLIGKKVIASKDENLFVIWDEVFDNGKPYNGIIIGNIYETARTGVIKATVLLK